LSAAFGISYGTKDWEIYCDTVYTGIKPFYQEYALDKNGNVTNGTHVDFSWSESEIKDIHKSSYAKSFIYKYDCRLDPCEIADDLNDYIEAVKRVTGHSKVSLIGRCLGTNIVFAYLEKYQADKNFSGIESVVLYDSVVEGVDIISQLFCGKIKVDSAATVSYIKDLASSSEKINDESLLGLISATVDLIYSTGVTNKVGGFSDDVVSKLYENTIPKLIRDTFATSPGYWSMVSDEYYEQAKGYIFADKTEEYATLISKIDNYHNTVQLKACDILKAMDASGVKLAIFAKYGFQLRPVVEDCDRIGDNTVSVEYQSFGATASSVNGTLSSEYIATRDAKYISPDKKIDASTCLLPNRTWFIKNLEHSIFPDSLDELAVLICRAEYPITVDSIKTYYPQFMKWTISEGITPLTESDFNLHDNTVTYSGSGKTVEIEKAGLSLAFYFIKLIFAKMFDGIKKLFS